MIREVVEALPCFGYAGMIFLSPLLSLSVLVGLMFTKFYFLTPLYITYYLFDRQTPFRAGRIFPAFRKLPFWRYLANYFPIRLHRTQELDPDGNYLFCFHPHGILVHGGICNFLSDATGFSRLFPGITLHFSIVDMHFHIPIHREFAMAAGLTSASASSIEYKLTKLGPGNSVLLVVGGEKEMPLSSMAEYKLYILNRKGFIRLALRTGCKVVPVFSFSESKLFHLDPLNLETASLPWRLLVRVMGSRGPKFVLRGNPVLPSLIPLRQEVNTVVGAPIKFDPLPEGLSEAEQASYVDSCHGIYLKALRQLYDENKAKFGDKDTPLIFC